MDLNQNEIFKKLEYYVITEQNSIILEKNFIDYIKTKTKLLKILKNFLSK